MAAPEDKLPRVSHADRPRDDEKVLRKGGADLNNGWLGRHGNLYLTEERLVFVPTPLDHLLMAKRRELPLDRIDIVERWPLSPGEIPRGAKRPRLYITCDGTRYQFLVGDMDGWMDLMEVLYTRRREANPNAHFPEFRREGVENALLDVL